MDDSSIFTTVIHDNGYYVNKYTEDTCEYPLESQNTFNFLKIINILRKAYIEKISQKLSLNILPYAKQHLICSILRYISKRYKI